MNSLGEFVYDHLLCFHYQTLDLFCMHNVRRFYILINWLELKWLAPQACKKVSTDLLETFASKILEIAFNLELQNLSQTAS